MLSPRQLSHNASARGGVALNSRVPKLLGHCALGHAWQMLYLDGKLETLEPLAVWQLVHAASRLSPPPAWVVPHHSRRRSLEAEAVCTFALALVGTDVF